MSDRIRVVYLGACKLKGGKIGSIYLPERVLLDNPEASYEQLFGSASAYDFKPNKIMGGVYEAAGIIEGDTVKTLNKAQDFRGRLEHPALARFEAETLIIDRRQRAAAAERKAKSEGGNVAPHIDALAALVAKASLNDADVLVQVFASMIRNRSVDIRFDRKGR